MHAHVCRQAGRQAGRQTDRQTDRHTYIGAGTSLASHHFRSPSAGRSLIRIRPVRIHPLPFACSPWMFRSPVQAHVSCQLHFSAGSALHWSTTLRQAMVTLYLSLGLSASKVLLLWHRLQLQVSVTFTINSNFETMGEVLHIVSKLVFSYMQLECTFLVLLHRGVQDIFPTDIIPNSIPAKFYYFNVVSVHNFHDISLSTPLSRLWGKPCTSSPTSLSPICSRTVHFSFAELRCLYIFPKRHYPFPACRETTLPPASYSSPFSGTMLQSERQVVTNPAVGICGSRGLTPF